MKRLTLAVILLVVGTTAAPTAAYGGGAGDPWLRYPCASGTIGVIATVTPTEVPGVSRVALPGKLVCDVPEPGFRYAVAVFHNPANGELHDTMFGDYASPAGPTHFTVAVGIGAAQGFDLCLMPDYGVLLSCVRVESDAAGAVSVSVSAYRPGPPIVVEPVPYGPLPQCGTCWTAGG